MPRNSVADKLRATAKSSPKRLNFPDLVEYHEIKEQCDIQASKGHEYLLLSYIVKSEIKKKLHAKDKLFVHYIKLREVAELRKDGSRLPKQATLISWGNEKKVFRNYYEIGSGAAEMESEQAPWVRRGQAGGCVLL